jgi:hypothetical protein
MNEILIMLWVLFGFIAMSFWESSAEGRKAWDKGKVGWKLKIGKYVLTTRYHLWVNVMIIMFIFLPLIVYGWNKRLFGILLSSYFLGFVLEDFFWYVLNPVVKLRELNTSFANYYPRIKIGKIKVPLFYFIGLILAVASWYFLWK